jgi:hypothetical protein
VKGSIPYVIDIHAHPEHLTAMPYFKRRYGARTVTGSRIGIVLRAFRNIYNQIMYNKILVPLDGSKLAEAVLPYAAFLASALQFPWTCPMSTIGRPLRLRLLAAGRRLPQARGRHVPGIHKREFFSGRRQSSRNDRR